MAEGEREACLESLTTQMQRLERGRVRAADPTLQSRLRALRARQASRLAAEYADQRATPERRDAVDFFLDDVYGADDFAQRDEQFALAMRHLQRMLPIAALGALCDAVELHALTIELDAAMAASLPLTTTEIDGGAYAAAYRELNRAGDRRRQIDLAVTIGRRLQFLTRHAATELVMRLAYGPARVAGFGAVHSFIQRGYLAFQRLGPDARNFVDIIESRETALMQRLLGTVDPLRSAEDESSMRLASGHRPAADSLR